MPGDPFHICDLKHDYTNYLKGRTYNLIAFSNERFIFFFNLFPQSIFTYKIALVLSDMNGSNEISKYVEETFACHSLQVRAWLRG